MFFKHQHAYDDISGGGRRRSPALTTPTPVVGVDPGGRQTGVVARCGPQPLFACIVTRADPENVPTAAYVAEVTGAVADALDAIGGQALVAVEGVVHPTGHVRMVNVTGLLGAAVVLGGVLAAFPAAVVVPPGGHGAGPLGAYPDDLCGPRESKGTGRHRHVRSAYDVAAAGVLLAQLDKTVTDEEDRCPPT